MKIRLQTGSEGPREDPYGYEEWTVTRTDGTEVVIHAGLAEWVKLSNGRTKSVGDLYCENLNEAAEALTGLDLRGLRRAYESVKEHEIRPHYAHGGMQWGSGFPGEELLFCKCGAVVDSSFNLSAIE